MLVRPGLSAAERVQLDVKWTNLRREQSDPLARDALPRWKWALLWYTAYPPYFALSVLSVPYLTVKYLIQNDSFSEWTYTRMLRNRLNKLWDWWMSGRLNPIEEDPFVRPQNTAEAYDMAEARGYVSIEDFRIPAVGEEMRAGPAVNPRVLAVDVPAYWLTPRGCAKSGNDNANHGEKVVLHIHGGGYLRGHPLWNLLPLEVVVASRVRMLSVNYRKPLLPHTAFPGPLLDVLAAYIHLIQLGFDPQNIVILGKSAGGNLALVLLRYLHDLRLPLPGKVGMMAPWCDLSMSSESYDRHKRFDTLCPPKLATAVRSAMRWYTPEGAEWFSPALAGDDAWQWARGVDMYMQVGTRELFEDEVKKTARDMRASGVNVRVREDPNGLHTSALHHPQAMAVFVKDMSDLIAA